MWENNRVSKRRSSLEFSLTNNFLTLIFLTNERVRYEARIKRVETTWLERYHARKVPIEHQ